MKPSFFTPIERINNFGDGASMNRQYGIQVMCLGDRKKLQALVPPLLNVPSFSKDGDREQGIVYIYIVNIREPTFSPWYMEGGIGIMTEYDGVSGVHFLGLQLSGPGAFMGVCTGREKSGLPKKLCERIHVERLGDQGHCFIERGGVRLIDVECDLGEYNTPLAKVFFAANEGGSEEKPVDTDGGCILFKNKGMTESVEVIYYDSPTLFYKWDPLTARVKLASSVNDPWGEIPIDSVIGGGWMVSDNRMRSQKVIYRYPEDQCLDVLQYLFASKYDQCIMEKEHQVYE